MKSILMSIQPKWIAKILNGEKTIEVRRKFPKDYVGWVYIYCTKGRECLFDYPNKGKIYYELDFKKDNKYNYYLNGKVVARFWCDKVEETFFQQEESFNNEIEKTLKSSCLTYDELWNYVENNTFYKIHISQLEIFDEPKELSEFKQPRDSYGKVNWNTNEYYSMELTKSPQSWQYIEGEME